jgi:biopolymer transport protein ExbD
MAGESSPKIADPGLKKKARIEIIPLIDVIFFLLATFVLFTLSLDKIASIPVQLPQAVDNPNSKPDENMLSIQFSDQGTIYWKIGTLSAPELITAAELSPRLENYKSSYQSNARVLVSGDIRAKFGSAVQVLDEVRKAGIEQVSVATNATPTGK